MVRSDVPLVSAIMLMYNSEKYLAQAIESVLAQSYKNWELIVIDDGSIDSSLKIAEEYKKKDKRIRIVRNSKNKGIPFSRNRGILLSRGKYITMFDSDDISLKDRLKEGVSYLENHPDCGIVGSWYEVIDSDSGETLLTKKPFLDDSVLRTNIFLHMPIMGPTYMIPKLVFKKCGLFNEEYASTEDIDLYFRIGEKYKFANIPKVLLKYRVHRQSITKQITAKGLRNSVKIRLLNRKNTRYKFRLIDFIYLVFYFLSSYFMILMPFNLKIKIYSLKSKLNNLLMIG